MLKKAKAAMGAKTAGQAQSLSKSVLASSHQIWLAGLGAFSKAQEGGAKVFDTLVKQGEVLEARTRKAAAETADAARGAHYQFAAAVDEFCRTRPRAFTNQTVAARDAFVDAGWCGRLGQNASRDSSGDG